MAERKTLRTLDLYMASFLAFHGIEPSLENIKGKIVFVFPDNDNVCKLMAKYNCAMVDTARFALVVRNLESQMKSIRNETGLWDWD